LGLGFFIYSRLGECIDGPSGFKAPDNPETLATLTNTSIQST